MGRASGAVIPPGFGRCDLAAPALPHEGYYPGAARGIVASQEPVAFGTPVPSSGRLPGWDSYPGDPTYLALAGPFPPMAGMKSASSWRRNHGIVANGMRTDITSALQTGNGRSPVHSLPRPPGWQEGWEPAPTFRFATGPCLRYFGSVLAGCPVHVLQGVAVVGRGWAGTPGGREVTDDWTRGRREHHGRRGFSHRVFPPDCSCERIALRS